MWLVALGAMSSAAAEARCNLLRMAFESSKQQLLLMARARRSTRLHEAEAAIARSGAAYNWSAEETLGIYDDSSGQLATEQQQIEQEEEELEIARMMMEGGGGGGVEFGPDCHSLYFILDFSHQYYIPLMIMLGLVGNLLSCVVFLSSQLRLRSSSYYLAALASADFGFLFSLLLVWLNNSLGWRVFNQAGWCESVVYASSVCSSLSVWLIVGFTVERFIAIQYPLHRPHMCTIRRAKCIIGLLTGLALLSHSYCFVTAGLVRSGPDGSELLCDMKLEHLELMRVVSILDSIASLILPLVLILVMNTMITRNLLRFGRRFGRTAALPGGAGGSAQTYSTAAVAAANLVRGCSRNNRSSAVNLNQVPSGSSSSNNAGNGIMLSLIITEPRQTPEPSTFPFPRTSHSHGSRLQASQPQQQQQQQQQAPAAAAASQQPPVATGTQASSTPRNIYQIPDVTPQYIHVKPSSRNIVNTRNQQNITKMLLLISTVFILLNLPSYVIRLCVFFFTLARRDTPALLWCLQQFFMLLYYTNFSINFLLYAMCGVTFRRCLKQLLRKLLKNLKRYHCSPQRSI